MNCACFLGRKSEVYSHLQYIIPRCNAPRVGGNRGRLCTGDRGPLGLADEGQSSSPCTLAQHADQAIPGSLSPGSGSADWGEAGLIESVGGPGD